MCKLQNSLFLASVVWCALWTASVKSIAASPIEFILDDLFERGDPQAQDYDLRYDQRQNGTENIRLKIDGVIVAYASPDTSAASAAGNAASDYLLQFANAVESADDDDFPFRKNAPAQPAPSSDPEDDAKKPTRPDGIKTATDTKEPEKLVQLRSNAPIDAEREDEEPTKIHLSKRNK